MPRVKLFDESEVLNKAKDLFWKKGYHATSMQDLVTNIGINRSSIYDTFGKKKELFEKAFQHYRAESITGLKNFLATQSDTYMVSKQCLKWVYLMLLKTKIKKAVLSLIPLLN